MATSKPTDSGPTSANPVTVTIGTTGGMAQAPFYVGVEQGIFLKHGIDLKILIVATAGENIKGLQSSQFQLSGTSYASLVPPVTQGIPLRAIALTAGRPDVTNYDAGNAIMIRPGVTATTVAGLKGRKIGVALGGTGAEVYLRLTLTKAGLDPDKDVTLVNFPPANQLAALQRGDIDAASMTEPYGTLTELQLAGSRTLVRGGGVSSSTTLVAALDPWVKQNPVVVERFLAGDYEAMQYVRQHSGDAGLSASHYISGLPLNVVTASLQKFDFDPRWSSLVQAGFEGSGQALLASGAVKSVPNSAEILVLDLLTNAQKKYPQYFNDLK